MICFLFLSDISILHPGHCMSAKAMIKYVKSAVTEKGDLEMTASDVFLRCACSRGTEPYASHFHNAGELIYVSRGRAEYRVEGRCYEAEPGSVVCVSRLEEHSVRVVGEDSLRYYLQVTPSQLEGLLDEPRLKSIFISRPKDFCHCFSVGKAAPEAEALFCQLYGEYETPGPLSRAYLAALFQELMVLLYRACPERFPLPGKKMNPAVYKAQAYLDQNFTRDISIEKLAENLYVSVSYLSHSFREWTGMSPKQYVMLSRLSFSKELLMTTSLPVGEIAFRSGFEDANNFIRSFRRLTGMTPGAYRKQRISL